MRTDDTLRLLRQCVRELVADMEGLKTEIEGRYIDDVTEVVSWLETTISNVDTEYGSVLNPEVETDSATDIKDLVGFDI